jgi:hypothetical protein
MLHHEDEGMMGSFVVIDTSTVGITEFEINDDISIFPNPASESLIIESKRNIDESSIQLFNTIGELLSEIRSELPARMNISNLPDGIYFLTISNSNLIVTKKIIKN